MEYNHTLVSSKHSNTLPVHSSTFYDDPIITKVEKMMKQYWQENPDLYSLIDLQKKQAKSCEEVLPDSEKNIDAFANIEAEEMIWDIELRGKPLREKIRANQRKIRQYVLTHNADIIPRTKAHNRKCPYETEKEEKEFLEDVVGAQVKAWRSMLPDLIKKFARIPDYRRAGSIKHKMTVLMVFALFAFIFRLSSRREMNKELTCPVIFNHLKKLFPELETIPHADTLARVLETTNPKEIEKIHMSFIRDLIKNKKFKRFLIENCVPISFDGSQKLYRQGLLQDDKWCERKVGKKKSKDVQQYFYTLEANITLKNGLTIPLITEYLYRSVNELERDKTKQDSEITAFERLSERLHEYFPRLKIIAMFDALFATQDVMGTLHNYGWEYIIRLPKRKLKNLASLLKKNKDSRISLPDQSHYRKRKQTFYWENHIPYGYDWQLNINLIACFEEYYVVSLKT